MKLTRRVMKSLGHRFRLARAAAELRSREPSWKNARQCFEALRATGFSPDQKPSEFLALLDRVEKLQPSRICEIGAGGGGTLISFAQACPSNSLLISVDLCFPAGRRRLLERFGNDRRRVVCIESDSHIEATKARIQTELAGRQIDFLFIDGDHSYAGVAADFAMYSPLVRSGGLIAFHDIVPDLKTRCGVKSNKDTGEVPRFWTEIKPRLDRHEEFIDDPQQDGYGIGLAYWSGTRKTDGP